MRKGILLLALMIFGSLSSASAQVICWPDVPEHICKYADSVFKTTMQHDPASIKILTPNAFRERRDSYAKETSRLDEKCNCFNFFHQRLMSNTFDPDEIMLLRDKPGGVHVSEVLISFEAFLGFDDSKGTTSNGVFHLSHNGTFDAQQMQVIFAYIEGYTDALRHTP